MGNTQKRASGVLAHPTSFPSDYGIGDLGPAAYQFLDWLAGAGVTVWQVLPLGPTDRHGSPYASPSSFAGNPWLISPARLIDDGLLLPAEADALRQATGPRERVDFGLVADQKRIVLWHAFERFVRSESQALRAEAREFERRVADWLDPYALFMAMSDWSGTSRWSDWPTMLPSGTPLLPRGTSIPSELQTLVAYHRFVQFVFFRQWHQLREYAKQLGIFIVGDLPIYVSYESADVWANPELFDLDDRGAPRHVAGVPPDYFSETGQLWGNALYDWSAMQRDQYRWWIQRVDATLAMVDVVRLDHFRGFQAYWSVPAGAATAAEGAWQLGPGSELLGALQNAWRASHRPTPLVRCTLPFIAEDLGHITHEVTQLRREFQLPGMNVLQFVLLSDDPAYRFAPDAIPEDTVVYTGTHDNDTIVGWYEDQVAPHPLALQQIETWVTGGSHQQIAWQFLQLAWNTQAFLAVAPLQDILALDSGARMNIPGTETGNWTWRFTATDLTEGIQQALAQLNQATGRIPG